MVLRFMYRDCVVGTALANCGLDSPIRICFVDLFKTQGNMFFIPLTSRDYSPMFCYLWDFFFKIMVFMVQICMIKL